MKIKVDSEDDVRFNLRLISTQYGAKSIERLKLGYIETPVAKNRKPLGQYKNLEWRDFRVCREKFVCVYRAQSLYYRRTQTSETFLAKIHKFGADRELLTASIGPRSHEEHKLTGKVILPHTINLKTPKMKRSHFNQIQNTSPLIFLPLPVMQLE